MADCPHGPACIHCLLEAGRPPAEQAAAVVVHQPEDRLMTLDEVAEKLGCSENTVRKLHRTGELPGLRLAGRIRMRLSTVERFMADLERRVS